LVEVKDADPAYTLEGKILDDLVSESARAHHCDVRAANYILVPPSNPPLTICCCSHIPSQFRLNGMLWPHFGGLT
jgi:hypothetical protein